MPTKNFPFIFIFTCCLVLIIIFIWIDQGIIANTQNVSQPQPSGCSSCSSCQKESSGNTITPPTDFPLEAPSTILPQFTPPTTSPQNFSVKSAEALLAASSRVPTLPKLFLPLPLKDMSKFNLGELLIWKEPGLVECEPWGPGQGYSACLPGNLIGDPPCPIFMDCDGDGYYWWEGKDCDENCPTCYEHSPHTTSLPDGRDQDCDGTVDDLINCIPQYAEDPVPFGYDKDCNWLSQPKNILVNEGEMGEIPTDDLHCQKIFGQCTDYRGGYTNCTIAKNPGYFVKSSGYNCGGGIWRDKTEKDAIFDCKKSLRTDSYKGYYGCGGCEACHPVLESDDACSQCKINATFDYPTATNYGPWGICHGYNIISCQEMVGCSRKIIPNAYH